MEQTGDCVCVFVFCAVACALCLTGRDAYPEERAPVPGNGWDFSTLERHSLGAGGRDVQSLGVLPPSDSQVRYRSKDFVYCCIIEIEI